MDLEITKNPKKIPKLRNFAKILGMKISKLRKNTKAGKKNIVIKIPNPSKFSKIPDPGNFNVIFATR